MNPSAWFNLVLLVDIGIQCSILSSTSKGDHLQIRFHC
ncbi:hypothetical protein Godav_001391 [Gossypium davidsonii]|uniref:Uncharacterized protein n=2 Tax=Gossypium TaxID=3633 RepID=A0A7J8T2S3_GOSDV|nr:hypothetical protein [Gossypium davidsonii]MBA0668494.1 hypothetical protein [Gossypium klotzschianum]